MPAEQIPQRWLSKDYDYKPPRRGQVLKGTILTVESDGIIVDVGLKREGFVPSTDIARLEEKAFSRLHPGKEVVVRVTHPKDRQGNLILSLSAARVEKDWAKARELLESGDTWRGEVISSNRGGLVVKFGRIHGFVPASHLWKLRGRNASPATKRERLQEYVGEELPLKVIEVDRDNRRFVLSERLARRREHEHNKQRLLDELSEGQLCRGTVSTLCDFGAFVDLGGADGLIHISELAWTRVAHPSEVLDVGDEVDVYVLRLDHERKRIALSLKRLQPDPWELVDRPYSQGQLVSGTVTKVVSFGAFVALDIGVEGLLHVSELDDPPPPEARTLVQRGDELLLRVLNVDSSRHRIGLSLKRVSPQEYNE